MHAGPSLPHIHLTLLTQYKKWWSTLPHCWAPWSSTAQLRCDLFPQHEKVSAPLKSQVFGGHTTLRARSIMSLFYMAHFEATAASCAISEDLIYWGANLCLAPKLWACIDTSLHGVCTCMLVSSPAHTCIHSHSSCLQCLHLHSHIIQLS